MMAKQGHPKGLYLLFVTEMAERFSYYGMRALFVLYLVAAFFNSADASQIYGSYTGLVYLTPLLGGYIADRYWGNRRSIIFGAIVMAIGQFLMFASACFVNQSIMEANGPINDNVNNSLSLFLMLTGLVFLIFGNGFFKPNISTMVGDLYEKTDSRKDSAFTIFYMGINVGAFIAPLICGSLGNGNWTNPGNFKWGFFCAGVAMVLSVLVFWLFKDKVLKTPEGLQIGLPPAQSELRHEKDELAHQEAIAHHQEKADVHNSPFRLWGCIIGAAVMFVLFSLGSESFNDYISAAIYSISLALPVFIITDRGLTKDEKSRIGVIYIIAVFVIFFWSAFEQAGSSLTLFADQQTDRTIGSWTMPTTWFQSINPIVVVCFAPIMAMLWQFLAKKKLEPFSPAKQAIGLMLLAIGYVVIAFATDGVDNNTKVSMWWLFALYFLHTIGELSLSPIGLSMVNKLSPARLASLLMGVWFMSNAASNILAGKLATLLPGSNGEAKSFMGIEITNLTEFFTLFAIMAGAASIILFALCPMLKKMMKGVQ
ncbi:MAG: peptide MFS transporter [Bacteroidales bacterium]|nr:peptide MFS transporter [Bacteroidales bacterium]